MKPTRKPILITSHRFSRFAAFCALILIALPFQAWGKSMTGRVVSVDAGDNITIMNDKDKLYKIRLADIDSPELKQSFGHEARKFTTELTFDKRVRVNYKVADYHGRLIGDVVLPNGKLLNEEVVRYGYAWHYRVKRPPSPVLSNLEYMAWKNKMGLWVETNPIPPWEFRRGGEPPTPPDKDDYTDYDEIFSYGIIGNPKTRIYYWPLCSDYPSDIPGALIFGSKLEAETLGFRHSRGCPE
ncbi:MAG: hypothetical protein G3M78_05625 [Candidatus Nitrohelix vancouverensis]|uniref:TNase-like domain-containing protein n=1 Tax=Candidatus Nitrohelix vancouverensis TaxID=2705534 RepID=A0A7T0G354_9BACT|nr:MAG: hypothetical protein G3M78_05625 [Candidatus Nitrohelix vancouverensis]